MKQNYRIFNCLCCLLCLFFITGCSDATNKNETDNKSISNISKEDVYNLVEKEMPREYIENIEDYKRVVQYRLSENFDNGPISLSKALSMDIESNRNDLKHKWSCMVVDMLDYIKEPSKSSFGYALKDINEDAVPELFWLNMEGNIFAIFTIDNEKAKLLDVFWPRYKGILQDTGKLNTMENGGASYTTYKAYILDNVTLDLSLLKEFGTDGVDFVHEKTVNKYYEYINGKKVNIDEERYNELTTEYPFRFDEGWTHGTIYSLY